MTASPPPRTPMAGGCLLVAAIFIGLIAGTAFGETSVGLVAGIAAGIALAVAVWLIDRRRIG